MESKDNQKKKRKHLTSEDLKRRLYQRGIHGNSMPSLKSPLISDKSSILYVNLNSATNKRQSNQSPKILKKTASAFGKNNTPKGNSPKNYFPSITSNQFMARKQSPFKLNQTNQPISKTAMNFYHKRTDSQPQQQTPFNSSFYKNESILRQNETKMTKRLIQKMSGRGNKQEKSRFFEDIETSEQKDQIIQKQPQYQEPTQIKRAQNLSSLQEYISLILRNVPNVDQFLYLVRHSSPENTPEEDNIYQLEIIDYQQIKSKDKDPNFEYYTISKKGFCHYYGGKPIQFIDMKEWLEEKQVYEKIKKLNFFSRFRRWKTIKMWIKKVVRHRIQKCAQNLDEKLFILNPTVRHCILQINTINLQMQKTLAIISRNEGTYTLQSFKHSQQKTRRQAASIVEEFSRRSRQSVRKCFEDSLQNLKQVLKTKDNNEDKNFAATSHNPKDNAFQVLGFPAKMSYEHRSKLRKLTGRFVRFSYLVDFLHLNGLAGIFKTQIQSFSQKLNSLQVEKQVQVRFTHEVNKSLDDTQRQKMFNIQLIFKPCQIAQYNLHSNPMEIFDISMKIERASQIFNPLYHIKQKSLISSKQSLIKDQLIKQQYKQYVPTICELWLTLKPTLDNIFDELSFLIKQSMASLKYFERWSKHRQMQKYINILQEWDDIVSENWQICENDNLDPISIIDNLESSMSKIKEMIQVSQTKLIQKIVEQTTGPLNVYWQNTQAQNNVEQLITNQNIENGAQTIQFYLAYMTQHIEKFQHKIPNSIDLGIFSISLQKMKHLTVDFMKKSLQDFKEKLPFYVEEHTNNLNNWLNEKSTRLREQIHNIDDFVRLNKSLKQIEIEFATKKDLCNDLGHIYQTMYNYKIESKKRKQFQVQTLKAKDQLEQLLINVEQNIQRKTEHYTREVTRYHMPNLLKQIQKTRENIKSEEFQSLKSSPEDVIRKLLDIKAQYNNLKLRKAKCLEYLSILKLSQVDVTELDDLQKQINARLQMWENLQIFDEFSKSIDQEIVSQMDLTNIRNFITEKRTIIKQIESVHDQPHNDVLLLLKQKIQKYYINVPLLQGFNDKLSDNHWDQIYEILKDYPYLDLRKKQFTLKKFLQTNMGKEAKKIEFIFSKAKVQNQLQVLYSDIQNCWNNTLVKSKVDSRFVIISNPQTMRQAFDYMLKTLCTILSNPFSQTLRQYSITYDFLLLNYNTFENWIQTQQRLLKVDGQCKLLDIKKIPDYSQFENCEKIYKSIMKLFATNRSVDTGVKMSKLFVAGLDERLQEIDECLKKVEDNIKTIIEDHRKSYPPFYLFDDQKLFKIITEPNNPTVIQNTAKELIPCIDRIELEGQRISGIYTFDKEKFQRGMIPTTIDIEQILLQITDMIGDLTRKTMRSCRYKAVETTLVKLIPLFQPQYLLAINKTDFTNYTEISIDNQSLVGDSLKEFYKVMKKDITEDMKIRPSIKSQHIQRYDTLLLQSLYHQQLLNDLIRSRISKVSDFQWQKQLRFYWQESNNDQTNISVSHCHAKIKYGNQYIGSKTKVVVNSDANTLFALSGAQTAVFVGAQYSLEKVLNFIGHRLVVFDCQTFSTSKNIVNFLIGNWYSEVVCFCKNFDYLNPKIRQETIEGSQVKSMKQNLLKKNVFNIKEIQKKQTAVFLGVSHENKQHDFRSKCRTLSSEKISSSHLKNLLKIKGIFENEISEFLLKLFEMVSYLQEKSDSFNLTLEHFMENKIEGIQNIQKKTIFEQFLNYVKPKMGLDNIQIIEQTVKLYISSQTPTLDQFQDQIIEMTASKVADKKQKSGSKRSSRASQGKLISKSQQKSKIKNKIIKMQTQEEDEDREKYKQVKQALSERNIVILTGVGNSKLHCLRKIYKSSHKIVEVFSSFQSENLSHRGIVSQYIKNQNEGNCILYFDGLHNSILAELESIWNNSGFFSLKQKIIEKNILIVIGVEKVHHFDYSLLSWLYIINVEFQHDYLAEVAAEWCDKHLISDKDKQSFTKFFNETFLPTFENWSIKNMKSKERNTYIFLTYLESLFPVKNLLQAMVYCFIRVYANLNNDYIKLEFLVKKLIGQDKIGEDEKFYDFVYCLKDEIEQRDGIVSCKQDLVSLSQSNNIKQGLVNCQKYMQNIIQPSSQSFYFDYIITPQLYHYCTIMNRILSKTSSGIYINGPSQSGKSSLYEVYKHLNYSNKSFLKLTMNDNSSTQRFLTRVMNNLNVHSLTEIKGKINYEKSIIMIDDINIDRNQNDQSVLKELHEQKIENKITLLKQIIQFKLLQYPSYYPALASSTFQRKFFELSQVSLILSGHQQIQSLKSCTIPIQMHMQEHEIQSVFNQYLRQRLPYLEVSDLTVNDMISTTFEICKKISARNADFQGLEISSVKAIINKFSFLKLKENAAIAKQVQKYWVYLLYEHVGDYDPKHKMHNSTIKSNQTEDPHQSVIMRQLRSLNLQQLKPQNLCYSFLLTRDTANTSPSTGKRLQFVKDIKKIFNNVNQKIQKYNESSNKRYGNSFDYIHFDQLIKKIIKLSNNLVNRDYLLQGRKGTGKETLVKLVAYLQGSNFKVITSPLKQSIIDLFAATNITTMSSYLITQYIASAQDISKIKEFYYTDFENEILNSKQLQKPIKVQIKQKDKQKDQKFLSTSVGSKTVQKTFANMTFTPEYYIAPKPKLARQDAIRYRDAIRIVLLTDKKDLISEIPLNIRTNLMIDQMQQIPIASVQEYNVKFLDAEQIKHSPKTSQLLAQIWTFEKSNLQLSLKSYDDSIRLFSSFVSTLQDQIKQQLAKYGRILELFNQLRKLAEGLELEVEELHDRIKNQNELLIIEQTQERKDEKLKVQAELHRKSTCLNKGQKIIEMLSVLVPFFKEKHSLIQRYVLDTEYFEESLAVAACYFTFLSQKTFVERRRILNEWYRNDQIPALMNSQPIENFLTLFNLYPEQFNAEPIDDLQDFYENMAIVFNSVKPVIIRDSSKRGKLWLETVCSFVMVSQRQSNFVDVICQNLVKPSNILIQIANQETMNNISTSFINTLIFLGESTQTITIKGQQIKVSPQAKFYVLLNESITIPAQLMNEFTIVEFSQNDKLLEKSLEYTFMSSTHPEVFYSQLEINKKIRNLKLQQQALMIEIAQNIFSPFQNHGKKQQADGQDKAEQSSKENHVSLIAQMDKEELQKIVTQINDKIMTRSQNLANKLKEKQQLSTDLQHKHSANTSFKQESQKFITQSKNLLSILHLISVKSKSVHPQYSYPLIGHQEFVKKIGLGLKRGFILHNKLNSLYLFAIKVWGQQYVEQDFYVFLLAVMHMVDQTTINSHNTLKQVNTNTNLDKGVTDCSALQMILNSTILDPLQSKQQFSQLTVNFMNQLLSQFTYDQLIPYLQFSGTINNLHEGSDRKIVLNSIWVKDVSTKLETKLQQSLKIVKLQVKDMNSIQNQIKRFIFEQNILVIESIEILEHVLQHLQKLGSHQKTLYFKCLMKQSQINKVSLLSKKYNLNEVNNIYENKNRLLADCFEKVQRDRQLKKLSSVTNIKSMKSIALINIDDAEQKITSPENKQERRLSNKRNSEVKSKQTETKKQSNSKAKAVIDQPQSKNLNKTQKTEKYLQAQQSQQKCQQVRQIAQKLYELTNILYISHNLKLPFASEEQAQKISFYVNNCLSQDQQFEIEDKIKLLLRILAIARKEGNKLIDQEISKKINQIYTNFETLQKQSNNDVQMLIQTFTSKIQQMIDILNNACQDSLSHVAKKVKKVQFQNHYVAYFKKFFTIHRKPHSLNSLQNDLTNIQNVVSKAKKIYDSIKNINEPITVKRNSRKSINAIFRKEQIKQKFSTMTQLNSSLGSTLAKKTSIKRVSKQPAQSIKLSKQLENQTETQQSYLAPVLLEIQYKKLSSKIALLTETIQKTLLQAERNHTSSALELLLLLLEDKIPGTWLFVLQNPNFSQSLASLFKRYIRLQEDMSFSLEKIKRSKHSEIDFNFLKYPLDFIQLHFKSRITYSQSTVYILSNQPTSEQLQSSQDHLKIASIQGSGWKFSNMEPNTIDILSGAEKPLLSEGKIMTSCVFIKKQGVQTINLTPIDVYESRFSQKPFMKVYANCKKLASFNSASPALSLFLKQEIQS